MTEILPGVTLDPKDEAGLEQAFGVTSNAEELVRVNRGRYSEELRKTLRKPVNHELSQQVQERDDDYDPERQQYGIAVGKVEAQLEDHLGHPVETAVVRGSGRAAVISYTYIGDRGSIEKDTVPFVDLFGGSKVSGRQQRRGEAEEGRTGRQRAQAAADSVLGDAEKDAAAKIKAAQEEAQAAITKAREEAEKALADAHAEAAKIREQAAEEAAKAAAKAEKAGEKKSSGGARKSSGGRRASSSKRSGS